VPSHRDTFAYLIITPETKKAGAPATILRATRPRRSAAKHANPVETSRDIAFVNGLNWPPKARA
jgi:hypothetical protein